MEDKGKPKIGRCPRLLGVRVGRDIDVEQMPRGWLDENGYLLPSGDRVNSGEQVEVAIRNNKGMSTSLSIEKGLIMIALPPALPGFLQKLPKKEKTCYSNITYAK